jgi:serine phosphatase RsbU (regulator of sigma subunit)
MAGTATLQVLLVEDNPGDARLIREMLKESGEVRFELTGADRLDRGVELLDRDRFTVVLLDLSLPDSHGLETFRALRAHTADVPVVVLTGLADENMAIQAVQEGAQDYLVKGEVDAHRLAHALRYAVGRHQRQQAREKAMQEMARQVIGAHEIEGALARMIERALARMGTPAFPGPDVKAMQEMERELITARDIQQALLPAGAPACPGFDIHGASLPVGAVGGDFFDYLPLTDGRLGLVVGDVTGHGLGPALLMAATRSYLRAFAQAHLAIDQVLAMANQTLLQDFTDGRNVTVLLAELDPARRRLVHTSAGHSAGYVLCPDGRLRVKLLSTDMPLGLFPGGRFPTAPAAELAPGEIVLLLTDGVPDAHSPAGEHFGEDRLLDVVREHRARGARDIVEALTGAVRAFAQGEPQFDDVTAVVVKVGGGA